MTEFFSQKQTKIELINENGRIELKKKEKKRKKIGWKSVELGWTWTHEFLWHFYWKLLGENERIKQCITYIPLACLQINQEN